MPFVAMPVSGMVCRPSEQRAASLHPRIRRGNTREIVQTVELASIGVKVSAIYPRMSQIETQWNVKDYLLCKMANMSGNRA